MELEKLHHRIPENIFKILKQQGIEKLRPAQYKAIEKELFEKNILVCTPTASGKTLVAEILFLNTILNKKRKAVYIVPLKALAQEKFKEFKRKYPDIKIALSIGDFDSTDSYLSDYDLIITTSEKLDSLIRHHTPWFQEIGCFVVDEIHLLNDTERGPTLEILITIIRQNLPKAQILGLSATIGNPEELAKWLDAELILDDWRPVTLYKGILFENKIEFYDKED